MNTEIDVLILHADHDNEAEAQATGWVSHFKRFLELMLTQVLGQRPNVLLKGEHDTITSPNLDNAAAIIAVVSPHFSSSGQCLDHLEMFYKSSEGAGARKTRRVFKVMKTPLALNEQPPRLRELLGYDMYQLDTETGLPREYQDYFSPEAERQYWMKIVDLAYDLSESLVQLKGGDVAEVKNIYNRKTIFLAETSHDLSVQRNIIKRELQRHGYMVLPDQNLPSSLPELEKVIHSNLEESQLSIHLIGAAYGEIPDGTSSSVVEIQNNLAAEKSVRSREVNNDFSRLIWISPHVNNASEKQLAFIEKIKRDMEAQEGAEILQTPIEDFKNVMREELLETARDRRPVDNSTGKFIYLVYDRVDEHDVRPFVDLIERAGYQVLQPLFDDELLNMRKKHIDNLRQFDMAVIYKRHVNEQWVRMKVLDLLKAPGFGRKKPILGKALFIAEGAEVPGQNEAYQQVQVIEGDPQKLLDSLQSFLDENGA